MKSATTLTATMLVALSLSTWGQSRALETVERTIYYDYLLEDGQLAGGPMKARVPALRDERVEPAAVSPVYASETGPAFLESGSVNTANRVDLVFVGDGYRASELGAYASRVQLLAARMFLTEPYRTYASYFNVHRVDVVSNESGVDGAPTQNVEKDTALDMTYWWNGVQRALHVDAQKAQQYANNAPDWDFIAAIANRPESGGLSLTGTGVVTVGGHHSLAHETLKHELGHQIGGLADEYFTAGTTYDEGFELFEPNVSILDESAMLASGTKWAAWLGADPAPYDGPVGTYLGGLYKHFGIYRPSANSLMRNLSRPFNAPSAEALVIEIYKIVSPIDASADPNFFYGERDTLWIRTMQPDGHELDVQWSLDGEPIPGATSTSLDLCSVAIAAGWHAVGVEVVDRTPLVKDEAARVQWMSASRFFVVSSAGSTAPTSYCSAGANGAGQEARMGFSGSTSVATNDLQLSVTGCPPGVVGVFFWGTEQADVPFGNGRMCVGGSLLRISQQTTDDLGSASQVLDFDRLPPGHGVVAGDVRNAQFWYRDTARGGSTFNLSDGLSLPFCP